MKLLLAVSGGIDSMYLAEKALEGSLFAFCGQDYSFSIAHCNFCLRGEESQADEDFVRRWCEDRGIEFFSTRFDTPGYAQKNKISIEMAARELRYSWFGKLCRERSFDATVLAHNANDNAETLLLNMLRGCGSCGMQGMSADSGVFPNRRLRPLLSISREQIQSYMLQKGLKWREDSSNALDVYKRNTLRHKVLPVFKELNPSYLQTLSSDMGNIAMVHAIAEDYYAGKRHLFRADPDNEHIWSCSIKELLADPHWKYLLFRELEQYGFNSASIDSIAGLLKAKRTTSGKEFKSCGPYRLDTGRGMLYLSRIEDCGQESSIVVVDKEGEYSIAGRRFRIALEPCPQSFVPAEGCLYFSADALDFPFVLRGWRQGDWMQPLGMKGRKKISDLFVDLKIPSFEKDRAVLLAKDRQQSEVLALLPLRINEKVKIKKSQTVKVLTICEI